MSRLILYTTRGCHLCDRLEAELARLGKENIELERVEIAGDESLMARYGTRIPLLMDASGEMLERGLEAGRLAAWLHVRGLLAPPGSQVEEEPVPRGARTIRGRRFLG